MMCQVNAAETGNGSAPSASQSGGGEEADYISLYGMRDNHTFKRYEASTVDDLIAQWRADLKSDFDPDISLCPIIVLRGKEQLRRVGEMVHPNYQLGIPKDEAAVEAFRSAALADPDISRLMAQRQTKERKAR
jgi:hypothetical protein